MSCDLDGLPAHTTALLQFYIAMDLDLNSVNRLTRSSRERHPLRIVALSGRCRPCYVLYGACMCDRQVNIICHPEA